MTIFVLVVFVLILFLIVLSINDYDFVAPGSLVCIMTLLSMLVMTMYAGRFDIGISIKTILLVGTALFSVCTVGLLLPSRVKEIVPIRNINLYSMRVTMFSFVFVLISTVLYFFEVRNLASTMGYTSTSQFGMLYFYRVLTTTGFQATQNKIVGQMVVASVAISYLVLIDFTKRIMYGYTMRAKKILIIELLTILIFVLQGILSGGRTQFLYYIESFLFLVVFFFMKRTRRRLSGKIIKRVFFIVIGTYIAFFLLGSLTGKTKLLDFSETLFIYIGSPIVAFDKLVNEVVHFESGLWGGNVFFGIYSLIQMFGIDMNLGSMAAPFVAIGPFETNIYGAYARYYADFGVIGLVLLTMLLGAIYQKAYLELQRNNKNLELRLAVFLLCSQFLFDFCIEERFFTSVLSLGTILRIGYMVVFYNAFRKISIRFK